MATFESHIARATRNLEFLHKTNQTHYEYLDWQVTIAFYSAVHFVNAHLAKYDMHYHSHVDTKHALNPENEKTPGSIEMPIYESYSLLMMLSRRSRYMSDHKNHKLRVDQAFPTTEKQLSKALRHLDVIISYFGKKYELEIETLELKCKSLNQQGLNSITKTT